MCEKIRRMCKQFDASVVVRLSDKKPPKKRNEKTQKGGAKKRGASKHYRWALPCFDVEQGVNPIGGSDKEMVVSI